MHQILLNYAYKYKQKTNYCCLDYQKHYILPSKYLSVYYSAISSIAENTATTSIKTKFVCNIDRQTLGASQTKDL